MPKLPRITIEGEMATGKTTLMQHILDKLAELGIAVEPDYTNEDEPDPRKFLAEKTEQLAERSRTAPVSVRMSNCKTPPKENNPASPWVTLVHNGSWEAIYVDGILKCRIGPLDDDFTPEMVLDAVGITHTTRSRSFREGRAPFPTSLEDVIFAE